MVEKSDFLITDERRLSFIKASLIARRRQSELVKQNETQNLTWDIIYQVAECHFESRQISIADVYNSVLASKSSTIKATDRLVRDGVLVRSKDKSDKRRNNLDLSKAFKLKFLTYLDELISNIMVDQFVEKVTISTIWSTQTVKNLLSALQNAAIPIMIHADDGEILMISKEWERLTGYAHRDIPTIEKWTEKAYARNNTVGETRKMISKLYRITEEHDDGIAVVYTKSGEPRTWKFRSAPLGKLSDGRANIISVASDITSRMSDSA